ncbi:Fe-S oxidoreductase [Planomonospora parontospora subsp. parontospora]|uniref:Fe-S oxidoreductase n=2 Tax=Planomonospora parontospora TaxID=58119 RepID=A0AA37F701_9ACTN|nr:Fe-S oxidoreductase [Planomonospora parontospora]GII11655.1 Fe-S oxidoreductase [Planomonospora parontospora subsp. parontospora]
MRVALFITCVNDTLFPGTGRAVVTLLRRLGCEVDFPRAQTCCGQMHVNTGYPREGTRLARHFADVFAGYDAVVTPSGSCAAMVREQYPRLARTAAAAGRPASSGTARDAGGRAAGRTAPPSFAEEVAALVPKVHDLSEFLVDVLGVTDVGACFPHRVTYHPTCHSLRGLRLGDRPTRLLEQVRGLELVPLPGAEECCGFGGTFAVKNPAVSAAMCADKAHNVMATGAEVLCAADNSCLMHIGGALGRQRAGIRVMHLAEILAATESGETAAAPAGPAARTRTAPATRPLSAPAARTLAAPGGATPAGPAAGTPPEPGPAAHGRTGEER